MATIKSYTDLEQSRKLAEILPLESADMCYRVLPGIKEGMPDQYIAIVPDDAFFESDIPAWSLASLLEQLPYELKDNHFLSLQKEKNEYCCCYEDNNGNSFRHTFADNPVDACVAMIEKLHELKML